MNKALALAVFLASALQASRCPAADRFTSAVPVWPAGMEREKNLTVGFRTAFEAPDGGRVVLRITASPVYRFYLNGEFFGHGPARGPHGFFRVDEWDLTGRLLPGKNLLAVEVAGYNINSYYLLDQPSFLQAEVLADCRVLASTAGGGSPFEAALLPGRVRKVQRFSYQRTFCEVYRLRPGYDRWRKEVAAGFEPAACAVQERKRLLDRRVPYPEFHLRRPVRNVSGGKVQTGVAPAEPWRDRSLTEIGPLLGGFPEKELEAVPSAELQAIANIRQTPIDRPAARDDTLQLGPDSFQILDFGTNLTGFIGAQVTVRRPVKLFITFDEVLSGEDVDFKRLNCVNAITYELPEGIYRIESFEPYTLRYIKLTVLGGDCGLGGVYLREYVNPEADRADFACSDNRLNRLFAAGRETFRQNAVDIFMDCPSRERAGWLCDSYFTARAAFDLCGSTAVEKNFFENYLLPDSFACLPPGMLPMCYPADHYSGNFIPNWAMWFVLQLEEYAARSGDSGTVETARPAVLKLFDYLERFVNGDGLLEKLDGWVFIEWSEANDFVQDVNYPTNMLYAAALEAAGRMYGLPGLTARADEVREAVRRQSFDGEFFVDNALREGGRLRPTRNRTEVCQYFAFFAGTASPATHPELWRRLTGEFGPRRSRTGAYAGVYPARPFIGNVLRLELLSGDGRCSQVLEESVDYYLEMARRTGTLWEFEGARASCNHGFASHIVRVLFRDVLGIHLVDPVRKKVRLRFTDPGPDWCQGRIPTPEGEVYLEWWKEGGDTHYRTHAPAGYEIITENPGGLQLVRVP